MKNQDNDQPPATLARYGGSWLIDDLQRGLMSTSKISSFNDPFEGYGRKSNKPLSKESKNIYLANGIQTATSLFQARGLSPYKAKQMAKKAVYAHVPRNNKKIEGQLGDTFNKSDCKTVVDSTSRVICFSSPETSPLDEIPMWSYYADSHSGVRIHIATTALQKVRSNIHRIQYAPQPPEIRFGEIAQDLLYQSLLTILSTKGESWRHENEIRAYFLLKDLKRKHDLSPEKTAREYFSINQSHVTRLDLGVNSSEDTKNKALKLRESYPHIKLYQAIASGFEYKLEYELIGS